MDIFDRLYEIAENKDNIKRPGEITLDSICYRFGITGWFPYKKNTYGLSGDMVYFIDLEGKTITAIDGMEPGSELILFTCDDGTMYLMGHFQDCCESVAIEDICGDINDLINTPIVSAEESWRTIDDDKAEGKVIDKYVDSYTWTFYRIRTAKGTVVIRWYGESNGYYSESVELYKVTKL